MSDQPHEPETSRAEWIENDDPEGVGVDDDLADALEDGERLPFDTDPEDEQGDDRIVTTFEEEP